MYVIEPSPDREIKIYLHCCGTRSRVFYVLEDLCTQLTLDFVEKNVGLNYGYSIKIVTKRASGLQWDAEYKFTYLHPEEAYWHPAAFIIRTEEGEKLTAEDLRPTYWGLRRWRYRWPRMGRKAERAYGTYRNPRTTNERRQAFQNKDEDEPPIRARRNKNNIITAWDDRLAHNDANWKTQYKRRHQYRPEG
jgi:hypothetical protein